MKKTILVSAILLALGSNSYAGTSIHVNFSTDDYLHKEFIESSNYEKFVVSKDQMGSFSIGGDLTKTIAIDTTDVRALFFRNASVQDDIDGQTEASQKANKDKGIELSEGYGKGIVANIVASDSILLRGKDEGIRIQGQYVTAEDANTTVNIKSKNVHLEGGTVAIINLSGGVLNINADTVSLVGGEYALNTSGNAKTFIHADTVQMEGDINFAYDQPSSGTAVNAEVDIVLSGKNSYWNGNTTVSWNGTPTDVDEYLAVTGMKLTLSDGAMWTPTATVNDSTTEKTGSKYTNLNNLTLDNGVVNITGKDISVTVDSMAGAGTVNLITDLNEAGQFNVSQAEEGSSLDVNLMKNLNEEWTADDVDAETASGLLGNVGGEDVVTKTEVKEGFVNNGFSTDKEGHTVVSGPNTLMQSSLELASAAPLALNRIMMNDVRKRLGDIRTSSGTHGAWARYDGGKLSGEGGLENDFHTIQVGIDTIPTADSARMGVAFSYTDSDAEYARGSADMKAYSLAMYATKMFDNGMFVDVIGRMGTADTDMVVDGQHKGSMNNVALSLSGEMGWRFDVNEMLYVDPQAEVTYTYVNDDKLSLSTANYDVDAVNSLMGRVGFAAGLKCPDHFGNVYVRASAVHEFLGDAKITGTNNGQSNTYEIDGQDTWVEYGVGANFNLTKSTYMWADVERTTGGALDEDWRATVGVRYAW